MSMWLAMPGYAAEQALELDANQIRSELVKIEADIKFEHFLLENLDDYLERLPVYSSWAKDCVEIANARLMITTENLDRLSAPIVNEPTEVSETRRRIIAEKSMLESKLSSCKAMLVRSDDAIKKIVEFRKANLEQQSLDKGRSIVSVFQESITESSEWAPALIDVLHSRQGIRAMNGSRLLMLLSIMLIVLVAGLMIRRALHRWYGEPLQRWQRTRLEGGDTGMRLLAALAMTTRRFIVPVLLSISIAMFLTIETFDLVPKPLITIIMDGLPILVLVYASTYFVFKALNDLGLREGIDPAIDRLFRKRLNLLATIWFIGHLLFQTVLTNSLPEAVFFLVRAVLGVLFVLNVIWMIWISKGIKESGMNTSFRILLTLILIAVVIAELTGYRNLSGFVLQGMLGTLIAYSLFKIFSHLINALLNEVDAGKAVWQQQLRRKIGVRNDEPIPGLIWLRLVTSAIIWLLLLVFLLKIWRVPGSEIKTLESYITQGFMIGSIEIVPSEIFEALLTLFLLLIANGWFQRRFDKKWLAITKIDRGARESIATIANYVGIALAIVIALVVAGLNFSKLAIVAGALSVGIGFGLQNIVNNFVSGLILLFERPIKTGDWIVAGGVEGFVKKISIRSTQIESFDRADIIVPNSELISSNLTNWLHKSLNGRIRIPVSVAYGSDTTKVSKLLIGIARGHKQVILNNALMHDPKVLFLEFGDSALNFELRFFVHNIQDRLDITSEVNFAIDQAFREHEIEIPFPQRVVYLKDDKAAPIDGDELIEGGLANH